MTTFSMMAAAASLALLMANAAPAPTADDAALRAAVTAHAAQPATPRIERDALLVQAGIDGAVLSPDGTRVAYLRERANGRSLRLLSTSGADRLLLAHTEARAVDWSHDGRWLLLQSPREVFALAVDGQSGSGIVTQLGGRSARRVLAIDPVAAAAVLVSERDAAAGGAPERWRLLRVDMRGRRTLLYAADTHAPTSFALAANGQLAFLARVEGDHIAVHRVGADGALRLGLRCGLLQRCQLLPRVDDAGRLWLRSDFGGDLNALQRLDRENRLERVQADPRGEADIERIVLDPVSAQPLYARYRSTTMANHAVDETVAAPLAKIDALLPHRDLDIAIGRGEGAQWLVTERASALRVARFHLYDPRAGTLREILAAPAFSERSGHDAAPLADDALVAKIGFAYRASDGMRLHGFLTLPRGADAARLPLVASVHGGPWNQSRAEFGAVSQLLANRGYAVFEPNFRGSTGHGQHYMRSARGDFGNGRVQQDIVDGVRHLLANGIGDGARVGISGASFGGYSALLGVTFQPELFRVAVAGVPPTDFAWNLRYVARSAEALQLSGLMPFERWARLMDLDPNDAATMNRLHAESPLAHVERMRRPLLLIAGAEDRRVALRGVVEYAARLKLLGKDVQLLVDPEGGHSVDAPLAREAYLYLLEEMLHRHLGGAAPTPPDAELAAYVERNLRIGNLR